MFQLIVGTSHCADLHAPSPNDIPAMTAARANISAFVSYTLAGSPDTPEPISSDTCDDNSSTVTALAAALGVTSGGLCIMLFLHFSRKKSDNHTAQVGLLSDSRMPNRV
jgi:hypothetical protein